MNPIVLMGIQHLPWSRIASWYLCPFRIAMLLPARTSSLCMPLNFCIFTQKNLYWKISYNQIFRSAHSITSMAIQCLAWIEYHWLIFVCRLGLTYLLLFCVHNAWKNPWGCFAIKYVKLIIFFMYELWQTTNILIN
jgi:hypothetical protein